MKIFTCRGDPRGRPMEGQPRGLPLLVIITLFLCFTACGHSELTTELPPPPPDSSVLPPAFALASDFPADIVIPNVDDMKSTAFIVSTSSPAGVIAVDIDVNPMKVSTRFKGLISPTGSGIPSRLLIAGTNEAFLTTSNSIISFNPTDGAVYQSIDILSSVAIPSGHKNSDGAAAGTSVKPTFPSGLAIIGDTLFVATANYIRTQTPALAAPGTVHVYKISSGHTLSKVGLIVTSAYNPTGLSVRNDKELIVTNSGVLSIVDAKGVPETVSTIDIVDPDSLTITHTISLGKVAASFHGVAMTVDGSRGFIGSSGYGHVYEIDFINNQALRGLDSPHVVTDASDYITDVALSVDNSFLFVASFEASAIYPFDLSKNPAAKGDAFVVGFPAGVSAQNPSGANSGAGPIAVRPGSRGVDYEGADLLVLTGYPGTLVPVKTDAPAVVYVPPNTGTGSDDESSPPPPPPIVQEDNSCQGFAQAVYSITYGTGAGFGQNDFPNIVLGSPHGLGADQGSFNVLSLGTHGEIILDLGDCQIVDGDGVDFIIFENPFYINGNQSAPYAELASVSVSENGINFVEFNCHSQSYPYDGCAGWHPVFSSVDNSISPFDESVAGGDQFDLATIGVARARYIKVHDLNGSGLGGTAGFDLDAVSVINGEVQ